MKTFFITIGILFWLTIGSVGQPQITESSISFNNVVDKYDLLEVQFDIIANFTNPYDPSEIEVTGYFISPDMTTYKLPGFYYRNIKKTEEEVGEDWKIEKLEEEAPFNWRLRFTPNLVGDWKFFIVVKDKYDQTHCIIKTFTCRESSNKGFVRKANDKYLKFDNGDPYFPVGLNLPDFDHYPASWAFREYGTNQVKDFMDKMKESNIGHLRFEINFFQGVNLYGIDLRTGENYYSYFNQKDSWQLDEIISYASEKEIKLSLFLNSWQDFGDLGYSSYAWTKYNPYNSNVTNNDFANPNDNSGNCLYQWDVFTNPEALQHQKNLIRYIVARWGYATNVVSFIVWDEANSIETHMSSSPPLPPLNFPELINNWHIPIISYIKEIDPFHHLVNSGNYGVSYFTDHEAINYFDFYQAHHYTDMILPENSNMDYDKNLFYTIQGMYAATSLPVLMGEFGYLKEDVMEILDPKAYGYHSILWSSLFSGSFGTPMTWELKSIWKYFPEGFNRYIGVGNFTKSLPQFSENLTPHWVVNNNGFRVCYLSNNNSTKFYGWMQDNEYMFANILNHYPEYLQSFSVDDSPIRDQNGKIKLDVTKVGNYNVEWYNTINGEFLLKETIPVSDPTNLQLEIQLPPELYKGSFADGAFIILFDCEEKWNNSVLNPESTPNVRINSNLATDSFGQPLYVGTDGTVFIMWFDGVIFQNVRLIAELSSKVRTNSGLVVDDKNRVYFIGEDNKIHRLYWSYSTEHWEEETITTTEPDYLVRFNSNFGVDKLYSIFYTNFNDNKVHTLWLNEGNYNDAVVLSRADEVANTSLLSVDDKSNIFYMGMKDSKMHKLYWNFNTKHWDELIVDQNYLTKIRDFSPIKFNQSNNSIYYFGIDNKLHEKRIIAPDQYFDAVVAGYNNYIVQFNSGLEFDSNNNLYFTIDKLIHTVYWDYSINDWVIEELGSDFPKNVSEYLCINKNDNIFYKGDDAILHVDYFGCDDNYKNISNNSAYKIDDSWLKNTSGFEASYFITSPFEESFTISPNPASTNLTVRSTDYVGEKTISVFSIQGVQVVKNIDFISETIIDVSNLPCGIYIVYIKGVNDSIFRKVIIE